MIFPGREGFTLQLYTTFLVQSTDFYCSLYSYLWPCVQSACMVGLLWFNSGKLLFIVCVTFEPKYQTNSSDNQAHHDLDIYFLPLL